MRTTEIQCPRGGVFLSAQVQNDGPCVWVLVDPDAPLVARRFRLYGTGHEIEDTDAGQGTFAGTFQMGPFVGHLWDMGEVS